MVESSKHALLKHKDKKRLHLTEFGHINWSEYSLEFQVSGFELETCSFNENVFIKSNTDIIRNKIQFMDQF